MADAATLVEFGMAVPRQSSSGFPAQGCRVSVPHAWWCLSLVDDIQRKHAQVAGTAEEEFLLADVQGGSTQQPVSHKRCLDDDNEVYAAKRQQLHLIGC